MPTTPSGETKALILTALDDYFMGPAADGLPNPKYSPEAGLIAETWMEEQETSEEERVRIDTENGERMKKIILSSLSSHEYRVLDEEINASNDEYESLRMAQKWAEQLVPGKDIL